MWAGCTHLPACAVAAARWLSRCGCRGTYVLHRLALGVLPVPTARVPRTLRLAVPPANALACGAASCSFLEWWMRLVGWRSPGRQPHGLDRDALLWGPQRLPRVVRFLLLCCPDCPLLPMCARSLLHCSASRYELRPPVLHGGPLLFVPSLLVLALTCSLFLRWLVALYFFCSREPRPGCPAPRSIKVVSEMFEGLNVVKRHKLVYGAIWEELSGPIHAVDQLVTQTPAEAGGK